jgi:hypothetical protein
MKYGSGQMPMAKYSLWRWWFWDDHKPNGWKKLMSSIKWMWWFKEEHKP